MRMILVALLGPLLVLSSTGHTSGTIVTSCEACHEQAVCHHTSLMAGDITCTCKKGFSGDGLICTPGHNDAGADHHAPRRVRRSYPTSNSNLAHVRFNCGFYECADGEDCITVDGIQQCADPCKRHTVLNEAWRSTNNNEGEKHCDRNVHWDGYYRMFIGNQSVSMPDKCVESFMCGTQAPLWLAFPHPQQVDAIVRSAVCASFRGVCCWVQSQPIHVKACPGNYFVYKFVMPPGCYFAYCACKVSLCGSSHHNTKTSHNNNCNNHNNKSTCKGHHDNTNTNQPVLLRPEVVCGRSLIQVGLNRTNLEAAGLDATTANLADPRCNVHEERDGMVWYQVERMEGTCGNTLETNGTDAIFSNSLFVYHIRNVSFTRPVSVPFSCAYPLESETSLDVAIKPYLSLKDAKVGKGSKVGSNMTLYRNDNFTEAYPAGGVTLPVGSVLHVGVSVEECPTEFRQVRVEESGSSLRARFSALLFLYQGDYRDVFLHCRLSLCDQRSSSCTPVSPASFPLAHPLSLWSLSGLTHFVCGGF
ncbi:unnamed protein product [Coregonus sp. 'balchen']|nr:unnamed protein product [Coregonus sp. 'balchen']